jgi:hypothetical protein
MKESKTHFTLFSSHIELLSSRQSFDRIETPAAISRNFDCLFEFRFVINEGCSLSPDTTILSGSIFDPKIKTILILLYLLEISFTRERMYSFLNIFICQVYSNANSSIISRFCSSVSATSSIQFLQWNAGE